MRRVVVSGSDRIFRRLPRAPLANVVRADIVSVRVIIFPAHSLTVGFSLFFIFLFLIIFSFFMLIPETHEKRVPAYYYVAHDRHCVASVARVVFRIVLSCVHTLLCRGVLRDRPTDRCGRDDGEKCSRVNHIVVYG